MEVAERALPVPTSFNDSHASIYQKWSVILRRLRTSRRLRGDLRPKSVAARFLNIFKNLAANDLVAVRSLTSRRLLCNLAEDDRGSLSRPLRSVEIVGRREVASYMWLGFYPTPSKDFYFIDRRKRWPPQFMIGWHISTAPLQPLHGF